MIFFFKSFLFFYKKFLNLVKSLFFQTGSAILGARFCKSDIVAVVIFFFFALFLFAYLFLRFVINFMFPFYFVFKRFFFIFINKVSLFFYSKLIDLLFTIFFLFYRFYNFLFFGVSYQDPVIKSLSQNFGMSKSEILREFYLLGHTYLFDTELAIPTSFFSSAKIFDTVKFNYILVDYSRHFKALIELQQFLRSYFFFLNLSNVQENSISSKPSVFISHSVTKPGIGFLKFLGMVSFAKFLYFCRFQALKVDTTLFLFLYNIEKFVRMHSYTFSFSTLLLYKYLDLLRRTSRIFAFDLQNDSFINYFFYLTKRFYASPMSSILAEVYVRKKIKLAQLALPSVSFFPVFFRDNFFTVFFSFLFVFVNVVVFSVFSFLFSFFRQLLFFSRYFSYLFLKGNISDFWFLSFVKSLFLGFFVDYYKAYNRYYFLHWFRLGIVTDFLILNFQFLLGLFSFFKLFFKFGFVAFLKFVFYYFNNFAFFFDFFFRTNADQQIVDEILFERYKLFLKIKDKEYFEKFSAFNQILTEFLNSSPVASQRVTGSIFSYFQRKIACLDVVFLRKIFFVNFVKSKISFGFFPTRFFLFLFYAWVSNFVWFFNILFTHSYFFLNSLFYFMVFFFFFVEPGMVVLFKVLTRFWLYFYNFIRYILEFFFLFLYKIYFYLIDYFFFIIFLVFFLFLFFIKLLVFFFSCFILGLIFLFKFFLLISYSVFVLAGCFVFVLYIVLYFLLYYFFRGSFFYYFFIHIYSFFLCLMFLNRARTFALVRNLGFSRILGILYLIRINFKSQQINHFKTPFLTGANLMTDFQVSDFFSSFTGRSPFFQHSNFRPKFLLFSEYLRKLLPNIDKGRLAFKIDLFCKLVSKTAASDDIEERFIRNLRKKYGSYYNAKLRLMLPGAIPLKYRTKFVPLKIVKIPDRILAEFSYHKFLRIRSFPSLKTFRYPLETLLTSIFYDKRFDNELSFFPFAKSGSTVTSNLLSYFYASDVFLLKDFAFFREIFSRKNLHFFYASLDSVSNFRVKFGKLSPIFRYFYLKRERLKFIFSHHLLGDISPFIYAIALNWLGQYRLLRSVLLDAKGFFKKLKFSKRYFLPYFEAIFLFSFFDIFLMVSYALKDYFFRFVFLAILSFFLCDYLSLFILILFLLFFSFLVFFGRRLKVKRFFSFFSYTRPFFFTFTYWFYSLICSPFSRRPVAFLLLNSVRFVFVHVFFRLFCFTLLCFLILFFLLFSLQCDPLDLILAIFSLKVRLLWLGSLLDVLILFSFDDFYIEDPFSGNFYRPFLTLYINFFFLFFFFLFFFGFFSWFLNFVLILVKRRFFSSLFFKFRLSPFRLLKELDFLISISESENLFIKTNIYKRGI